MGAKALTINLQYIFDGEKISNVEIYDDFKKFSDYSSDTDYIAVSDDTGVIGYIYCSKILHTNSSGETTDQHFATFLDRNRHTTYVYKTQLPDLFDDTFVANYTSNTTVTLTKEDYPYGATIYAVGTKGNNGTGGGYGGRKNYVYDNNKGWIAGANGAGGGGGAGGNGGVSTTLNVTADDTTFSATAYGSGGGGGGGGGYGGYGERTSNTLSGGIGGAGGISSTVSRSLRIDVAPCEKITITVTKANSNFKGGNGGAGVSGYLLGGAGGNGYGGSAGGSQYLGNGGNGGETSYNPDGSITGDKTKILSSKNMNSNTYTYTNVISGTGGLVICKKNKTVYNT